MRWEDERYVRFYTRNTPEWLSLSWVARGLLGLIMREVDRAGILKVGKTGLRGIAVILHAAWEDVEAPLAELMADGCVSFNEKEGQLCLPNFLEAQEAKHSDRARKQKERETARDKAATRDPVSHAVSRDVTRGHDGSLCAVPSVPNQPVPPAVVISEVQDPPPSEGKLPDGLVRYERPDWERAYAGGVESVTGEPHTFQSVAFGDLRAIVETHCKGQDRTDFAKWIERSAAEFARAVSTLDGGAKMYAGNGPGAMLRWYNAGRPGRITQAKAPEAHQKAPELKLTAEERAENARRAEGILANMGAFGRRSAHAG